MGEFGTGLRAHMERLRDVVQQPLQPQRNDPVPPPVPLGLEQLEAERRRLAQLAARLDARELALAQREAELEAAEERLALSLSKALIAAAKEAGVASPLDEVTAQRARRFGVA